MTILVLFLNQIKFFIGICVQLIVNIILKYSFHKIYKNRKIPLFGSGLRPEGAANCGFFYDKHESKYKGLSYGFPSGHSQSAAFISFYLYFFVHKKYYKTNKLIYIILTTILILLMVITMLSRIYVENCHTIGQVIAGALIGAIIAYIYYYIAHII